MQRYIANNAVPRRIRCNQVQRFRSKKFQLGCKDNNKNLLFAQVDDHGAKGLVELLIQTLKTRLGIKRVDPNNTPKQIASDVSGLKNTKNNTVRRNYVVIIRNAYGEKTKSHIVKASKNE